MKHAIYKITNLKNNNFYVGSSVNWKNRRQEHFRDLQLNKHHSRALQRAYNKYGKINFIFEVIELVPDKNNLISREQYYLDTLTPKYNCCKIAGSRLGCKMTKFQIKANSIRNSGDKNANCKIKNCEIAKIIELRKTNSIVVISKKYNVHISTIQRILKKEKILSVKIYSKETKEKLSDKAKKRSNSAKVILDVNCGVYYDSLTQLSNLLLINPNTLRERIKLKYNPLPQYKYV